MDIREQFPILKSKVKNNKELIYFDSAATTLKPKVVVDRVVEFYHSENSNVHRGAHFLSQKATDSYEGAREKIRDFISAKKAQEIIFTSGVTDAINLIARTYGELLEEGDEIIISAMEHHANIVPWQILRDKKNIVIKILPIEENGDLIIEKLDELFTEETKLLSLIYTSNSIGAINPVKEIISYAHQKNVDVLIDAAQASAHEKIDVVDLDVDFLVFSSHKMYGPTGVGVLYGKKEKLEKLPPYRGGGDMILKVTFDKTIYNELPYRLEAGTPNIAGVVGFGAAIDFINKIGFDYIAEQENILTEYMSEKIQKIKNVKIIGKPKKKCGIFSFVVDEVHAHDISTLLDDDGVATRTGHHCTHPLMDFFKVSSTTRASLGIYNTKDEVDIFIGSLERIIQNFC